MRSRILIGIVVVIATLGIGALTSRAGDHAGARQWSIVNFPDPILVKGQLVMGPVLIVHDSEKMAQGEACTSFYRFEPGVGPKDEIVSFHCKPIAREKVEQTTFAYAAAPNGCKRLTEYQIAGDAEAHEVPVK
ncbi:MAG TPA: hypothetical protein VKE96_25870 [Vicinamibacterales bacterium]|nr:hypothetical protein [Vicinamibacterales bacterium]